LLDLALAREMIGEEVAGDLDLLIRNLEVGPEEFHEERGQLRV
jgi:hypothetical protein